MPIRWHWRGPSSMWQVLALGFSLILGLWILTSIQVTRRMAAVQDESAALNARYLRAQDTLTTARSKMLLSSAHVRDALFDPDPHATARYGQKERDVIRQLHEVLAGYERMLPGNDESIRLQQLSADVAAYEVVTQQSLDSDTGGLSDLERLTVVQTLVSARDRAVNTSESFQAANRADYVRRQAVLSEAMHATQRLMNEQLGAALLVSLLVGWLATRRASGLERHLQGERARAEDTARELQRLSARLVTVEEDERRTIARELHDEVGQLLSAVKVELALIRRTQDAQSQSRLLTSAEHMADEALQGVRDLSRLLHPALLDDLGLSAAVDWYLQGFGRRTGLRVELLQEDMEPRLPSATEAGAYRIIQEALSNIARHARASVCRVYLQRLSATVLITVEDDGIGFDPTASATPQTPGGLGLIGIRERAWQLGGTVRLESAPGTGTRLTVELPFHDSANTVPGAPDRSLTRERTAPATPHAPTPLAGAALPRT